MYLFADLTNVSISLFDKDNLHFSLFSADLQILINEVYLYNNITLTDTESATIAYICKANNVEYVVIKSVNNFPTKQMNLQKKKKRCKNKKLGIAFKIVPLNN